MNFSFFLRNVIIYGKLKILLQKIGALKKKSRRTKEWEQKLRIIQIHL